MLTLIKFDLKNTWFKIALYCGVIAVFTLLSTYFWSASFEGFFDDTNFYWVTIFKLGSLGVTGAVCFICLIMTFIALAQWFAQNLFAEEGHFMNMLPISKIKLFLSKVITALIWNAAIIIFIILCICFFLLFGDRFAQINDVASDLMGGSADSFHIGYAFVQISALFICHCTAVTVLAYTSVCLGQLVDIGKNLLVLVGFLGVGLAELIISVMLAYVLGVFNMDGMDTVSGILSYFGSTCIKMSAVSVLNCALTFALGSYLISTGLNVD